MVPLFPSRVLLCCGLYPTNFLKFCQSNCGMWVYFVKSLVLYKNGELYIHKLAPSTHMIRRMKRKVVSDGNTNGFSRGRRGAASVLFIISSPSSRARLNQTSYHSIGQQLRCVVGKFELAGFFVGPLAHLHKLFGCEW